MYQVSHQFKENIVKNARRIKGYIDFHNTIHDFVTCTLDDNIYSSETNTFIGSFIAKSGTIKIDYKDSLNLENGSFLLYFGIQLEDETIEYVPMGKMNVYEKISDNEYKFMDNRMYFNNHFDDTQISYPITVLDYLKSVCEQASCELETTSFPNSDFVISKRPYTDGYIPTMSEIVIAIAQISCSFAHINRNGNLELNWFTDIEQSYTVENLSSYPVVYEKYGPVNQVILSTQLENNSEGSEVDGTEENTINQETVRQDDESIETNGITSLKIIDNPIANLGKDEIVVALWNRLKGFEYIPYNVSMQGQFHLDTGDMIDIETKAASVIKAIVMNHTMSYSGGISSSISAEAQSENQITYAQESSSNILMNQNFVKLNAEILNVSKKFTALNAKIDNLEVGDLNATYARIDLSNVGTEYVDNLFAKSGVFEKVTGEEGILYELTSVKFNGDLIKANTIVADSLVLTGLDGLYYRMNAEGGHLTEEQLSNEVYQKYLDGTNIVANSVTADKMNVNKLSALTSNLGDITGGSININDKFMVDNFGNMRAMNGEFNGVINATSGEMNNIYIGDENNNFLINKNGINGVNYIKVESEKSGNKSTLAESRGKYIQTTFDTNHYIIYTSEAFDGHFNCESKRFYEDTDTEFYNLIKSGEYTVSNVNIGEFCLYFKNINDSADGIKIDLLQNNLRFGNVRFELNPTGRSTGSGTTEGRKYITLITGIRLEVYLPKNFLENETDSNADISDILFKIFKKLGIIDDNYILSSYSRQISIKILKEDPDKNVHIGTDYISLGQGFYMTGTGKNSHIGNWYFDEDGWFVSYLPTSSEVPEQYVTLSNSLLEFKSTNKLTQIGANDIVLTDTSTGGTTTISNTRIFIDGTGFEIGNYTNKIYYNCANDGGIEIYNGYVDFHCQTGNDFDIRIACFNEKNLSVYGGNLNVHNGEVVVSSLGYRGYCQFRAIAGNYGFFIRNDGTDTWFMVTNRDDVYGSYSNLRPISISNYNGNVTFRHQTIFNNYLNLRENQSSNTTRGTIIGSAIGYGGINFTSNNGTTIQLFRENTTDSRTVFRPSVNGGAYLGTISMRWNTAFFTNAITNSDLKNKDVIKNFDFKVKDFIMGLEPIAYRRNGQEDTGKRIHIGLGAQTLAKHINDLDVGDLSMVQASIIDDENEKPYYGEDIDDSQLSWGINYTELIPYTILMEQDHEYRIQQLEKENMYLRQVLRDNNLLGGTI